MLYTDNLHLIRSVTLLGMDVLYLFFDDATPESSLTKNGIFTAVTENKFIVVDGIIASPFSQDRKIERQHQTRERQRLLQSERKLLRGQN